MSTSVIALFGEAERGALEKAYYCKNLRELFEYLGEPPDETHGLFFAIQTLLFGRQVIYFRVREEGISVPDYQFGLHLLRDMNPALIRMQALFLPGCGSSELLDEGLLLCKEQRSLLIVREVDFYDYMTESNTEQA